MTQKNIKIFINEIYSKPPKSIMQQTKQMFILLMTFGLQIFSISKIMVLKIIEDTDMF